MILAVKSKSAKIKVRQYLSFNTLSYAQLNTGSGEKENMIFSSPRRNLGRANVLPPASALSSVLALEAAAVALAKIC